MYCVLYGFLYCCEISICTLNALYALKNILVFIVFTRKATAVKYATYAFPRRHDCYHCNLKRVYDIAFLDHGLICKINLRRVVNLFCIVVIWKWVFKIHSGFSRLGCAMYFSVTISYKYYNYVQKTWKYQYYNNTNCKLAPFLSHLHFTHHQIIFVKGNAPIISEVAAYINWLIDSN